VLVAGQSIETPLLTPNVKMVVRWNALKDGSSCQTGIPWQPIRVELIVAKIS